MVTTLRDLIYGLAWSTPTRKGMTLGLLAGIGLTYFIPAMGLAVGGSAFAISGWVAGALIVLTTYVGARLGRRLGAK